MKEMWRLNQTKYNICRAILVWKKDHFSSYFQKMQTQFSFIYHVTPLSCFQCTCILFSHQMNLNQGVRTFHQHHHDNNSSSGCNNKRKKRVHKLRLNLFETKGKKNICLRMKNEKWRRQCTNRKKESHAVARRTTTLKIQLEPTKQRRANIEPTCQLPHNTHNTISR